jgi:hypothetical protein
MEPRTKDRQQDCWLRGDVAWSAGHIVLGPVLLRARHNLAGGHRSCDYCPRYARESALLGCITCLDRMQWSVRNTIFLNNQYSA